MKKFSSAIATYWPTIWSGLTVLGLILLARWLGIFQGLELKTLDVLLRLRPAELTDERILIVGIDEADIQRLGTHPISDAALAALLNQLDAYQPRAVGITMYRDLPVPPGHDALVHTWTKLPYVVGIEKVLANPVSPPPSLPASQVGFVDLPLDADGFVRRVTLGSVSANDDYQFALAIRLAEIYLASEDKPLRNGRRDPLAMRFGDTELPRFRSNTGGYVRAEEGNKMLLNVRSGKTPFRTVSLGQVMAGEVEPDWIHEAIVLVGLTSPSTKDFVNSAAIASNNPGLIYSVDIHAHATSQIISAVLDHRPLLRAWPDSIEYGWITLWGLAGIGVTLSTRRVLSIALAGLIPAVGVALIWMAVWTPTLVSAIAFVAASAITTSLRLSQTQQQQQVAMRLLGQQTSPEIAKALWDERQQLTQAGKLSPQELTATVLFSDIRSFTTLSEQQSPQQVMGWLNDYFMAMTDAVQQHHGVVNKFTGDGLMAVFGVPIPRTTDAAIAEDAQRAVACALTMESRLEELNQVWGTQGLPQIQIRIGIFTGPVVVGSLGGPQRLEYSIIGDSVNTASRLESCEKRQQLANCRCLVAQETLAYLKNRFVVEAWGEIALQGKQNVVQVYRVLGRQVRDMS